MTNQNTITLQTLHFEQLGVHWLGRIEDYLFDIVDIQDKESELRIAFSFAPNDNKSSLFSYFDELQKDTVISGYTVDEQMVAITFLENGRASLNEILQGIVEHAKEIAMTCKCSICDNTSSLHFFKGPGVLTILCDDCEQTVRAKSEKKKLNSNQYIRGFIGSLVGALICSIGWILIGYLGFMASIAAAGISFGAFYGYTKLGGRLNKLGVILNIVAIVIAVLFAQYAVLYAVFAKHIEGLSLLLFIERTPFLFSDKEFVLDLLPDMGFALLFAFLGCASSVRKGFDEAEEGERMPFIKINV